MTVATQELISLCESLPGEKQVEVADFARFLLAQCEDAAWEAAIANPAPRPRLEAFLRESATEPTAPLDLNLL